MKRLLLAISAIALPHFAVRRYSDNRQYCHNI
jgi:hypothetical protein